MMNDRFSKVSQICLCLLLLAIVTGSTSAQTWTERADGPVTKPSARRSHAMAYDVSNQVTVLFGGIDDQAGTDNNETWLWDGSTWSLEDPNNKPSPRAPEMAYDSDREVAVLFGGAGVTAPNSNETWEWNGVDWSIKTPANNVPSGRRFHAMAYDSVRKVVVMFGGILSDASGSHTDETWEWDGYDWQPRPSATKPPGRAGHDMVFDRVRGVIVMFGGLTCPSPGICPANTTSHTNDTWEWDGTNWTQRFPSTQPSPRRNHGMAYDSARNVTILFGGCTIHPCFPDSGFLSTETWEWDGTDWILQNPLVTPSARHSELVYDSSRNVAVMFGGQGADTIVKDETWEYSAKIEVGINIKPGSDPNSINTCSGGTTPVTIWGSETLDVTTIDPAQLILASATVKTVGKSDRTLCNTADEGTPDDAFFDSLDPTPDGFLDLTCHFITFELTDLDDNSTTADLSITGCEDPIDGCAGGDSGYYQTTATDSVNIVKDC